MATATIEARKARDKEARRAQIITAARKIAQSEGWPSVTVRRLSDEIAYSQPVLYSHFENRDAIVSAVAMEGFQEIGVALEAARLSSKRGSPLQRVAEAYLQFAAKAPALYEAMFTLSLNVPFDDAATPAELRSAFSQILLLFPEKDARSPILAELFWAGLHGIAELTRTKRFSPKRQKERLKILVQTFT